MNCGAEIEANALLTSLIEGVDFAIPEVDLTGSEFNMPVLGEIGLPVSKLTNADLTTGVVGGTGTFDVLMTGLAAHLKGEFDKQRITGEQYAKVYIALTEGAMSNAVQFLLGRDQAYWQAITAQLQAQVAQAAVVTARVQLETAKVQLQALRYEVQTQKATYALTKMKLASESVAYCIAQYQLEQMLPAQLLMLQEQGEAQRAQTMNTRTDGVTAVVGAMGKQKDLYEQQIDSYKRDAETKAAKMFIDAWITMKTIDEGVLPPENFTNLNLDEVLTIVRANNGLGT